MPAPAGSSCRTSRAAPTPRRPVQAIKYPPRAGEHIARLAGVEAAHVTSGSAGGLLLAAAARIAGTDPERIARLPDTTDMRNEIVIQRCDRIHYDQALRTAGARLVVVGDEECCTPTQIEAAIGERTAALIYIVSARLAEAGVPPDRMAEIAHAHMAPVAAAAQPALKVAVAISPLKGRTPDRWDPAGISGRDAREGRRREETADIPGW